MQKYDLDLETILSLLEEVHQNGILFANAPPGLLGQKTGCQIRIDLVEGKIAYCHVEDGEGRIQILSNNKAFRSLYGLGTLEWHLEPRLPDSSLPADTQPSLSPTVTKPLPKVSPKNTIPLSKISSIVPRRIINVEPRTLQMLSRNQRRTLVLVDGARNIEKITSILYSSSQGNLQAVLKILRELESLGLIVMEI